jgi:hypothetical protein
MANVTGWGRGTWSEATWGEPIPVEVTGVSITAELGNETITANVKRICNWYSFIHYFR